MSLARTELTGPSLSRLGPSLQWTARRLWTIYIVLTLIEMILLRFVGEMGLFDSVNYALTTFLRRIRNFRQWDYDFRLC